VLVAVEQLGKPRRLIPGVKYLTRVVLDVMHLAGNVKARNSAIPLEASSESVDVEAAFGSR
jgi:hypothetical protein